MGWTVTFSRKVEKAQGDLPEDVRLILVLLVKELQARGPVISWKGFGALKQMGKGVYHAHLKGGRPTYVACWAVVDKNTRTLEVFYVGTHEKAPY